MIESDAGAAQWPAMLAHHWWLAFSPDTDPEKARARFVQRYGREPEYARVHRNVLWCGPVSEKVTL